MTRILLLMEQRTNARLLSQWLDDHYTPVMAQNEADLQDAFDLCLVDGASLDRAWEAILDRKALEDPVFLPFLLVTTRQDAGPQTRHLWRSIDEFITLPVEKAELQARIEMLLRARRQSAELKRRNRDLEALTQALGHDLRAPARIAGGFADALLKNEREPLTGDNVRYANHIRSALTDMEALLNSLLKLCRLGRDEVRLRPIPVQLVVESCLRGLEPDLEAGGARVEVGEGLPVVLADTILLKMILTNLISNALKFVPPGVVPAIHIYGSQRGEMGRVNVQDNGVGIEPADQRRIFEPFVRLYGEEDYAGVGLGLPTVERAVELMGGQTGVISTPGAGSTFWVELPCVGGGE